MQILKVTAGTVLISEYSNCFCKVLKTPSHSIPQLPCLHLLMLIYMEQPTVGPRQCQLKAGTIACAGRRPSDMLVIVIALVIIVIVVIVIVKSNVNIQLICD